MKQIKVKKDFTIGEEYYSKGDTIDTSRLKYKQIVTLNEKGYIDPLTLKDLIEIKKGNKKIEDKEEE